MHCGERGDVLTFAKHRNALRDVPVFEREDCKHHGRATAVFRAVKMKELWSRTSRVFVASDSGCFVLEHSKMCGELVVMSRHPRRSFEREALSRSARSPAQEFYLRRVVS
ncbi:hypothetical protein NDU88_006265 [Pleurodeles waltl]|uniref:Uncharacterized protein n=1 Tax=Pleurodeles waltl TaxID=8319 RepID=A0AAV7MH08_PLEWA|nr:hypothetical protein NDU88_006265 [Pleurodeles waltl]